MNNHHVTTVATQFVVIDVGCLECHTESNLLGTYPTLAQAKAAHPIADLRSDLRPEDWGGESMLVIFEVPS